MTAASPRPAGSRLPYVLLAALLLVAGVYQAWFSHAVLQLVLRPGEHVGPPFGVWPFTPVIARMSHEATAAGLKQGDEVTAIGGRPYTGGSDLGRSLARSRPGDALTVTVRPSGGGGAQDARSASRRGCSTGWGSGSSSWSWGS